MFFATLLLAALAAQQAWAQSNCSSPGMYGQACNYKVGCACDGTKCNIKPCYVDERSVAAGPTDEDLALCNVNNATTFILSTKNDFSPSLVIRTPLRVVTGSSGGGEGLLGVSVRVKSAGCTAAEQMRLSDTLKFSTAADGALLVDVGAFVSLPGNVDTSKCNTWTRPDAEAAKAREAALDKQCPWRLDKSFSCATIDSTTTPLILDGRVLPTSSEAPRSASGTASGTASVSNNQQSSATLDEPGSAVAPAVSSVALCAAAAVAAMNRAPWHVQAAAGVAGLFAVANAQQTATCDVWIEVLGQTNGGGHVSVGQRTNGTDVVLSFGVAVPGRPFVDNAGKAIVTGLEHSNDTKAAPSAICPRKSGTGSLLTSMLIEAASAELAAATAGAGEEEMWLMQATAEHASVASFAQFSLNLMANAAPSPLLASSLRAAQDEVLHADACLAMARAVSSKSASFEAFPASAIDGMRAQSLGDLTMSTLREGGIAELVSTLDAVVSVGKALSRGQESVAGVWRAIATDESRHALLAWRTIAWAVRREPALVDQLAREIESTAQAVASNARHTATMDRVVKPLFACVRASTFEDVGNTIDERVTSALNALELSEFSVDTVMTSLRDAVSC
jgi:hypothetical protein